MTKLSEHFTLEECIYSETAQRLGIDNTPNKYHLKALKHTCEYLLEPLRDLLGRYYKTTVYINITSGYRNPVLNKKVNGAKNSQHANGEAFDIEAYYFQNKKKIIINYTTLYELIKKWVKEKKISVDQCIQEYVNGAQWVHCSHSSWGKARDRRQFMKYNGKYYVVDHE